MENNFNFFAEADPQYIFAYMDALAMGEQPASGENSRDPFFVHYAFLKEELAKARQENAELALRFEKFRNAREAEENFRMARNELQRSGQQHASPLISLLVESNKNFAWLIRQFQAARDFPLFAQDPSSEAYSGFMRDFLAYANMSKKTGQGAVSLRQLKNGIWLRFLAVLNVQEMNEIFLCCEKIASAARQMPEILAQWFCLAGDARQYFRTATRCLDLLDGLSADEIGAFVKSGTSGGEFDAIRRECVVKGDWLARALYKRAVGLSAIYALAMSAIADPSVQLANDLCVPKGGLARFIAATKG